jgi:hypothetical protein
MLQKCIQKPLGSNLYRGIHYSKFFGLLQRFQKNAGIGISSDMTTSLLLISNSSIAMQLEAM